MSRFTIREMLLVTLAAGLALGWWLDRDRGNYQLRALSPELRRIVGAHLAQRESGRTEVVAGLMELAKKHNWKLPESPEWWDFTDIQMVLIPGKPPSVVLALRTPSLVIPGDDQHSMILLDESGRKIDELRCVTNSRFTGGASLRLDQLKNQERLLRLVLRFKADAEQPDTIPVRIEHSGKNFSRPEIPVLADSAGLPFAVLCECEVTNCGLFIQSPPAAGPPRTKDP